MRDRNFRPLRALAHSLRALPDSRRERGLLCRELLSRTLWLLRNRNYSQPSKGNQGDGRRPRIAAHDSRVCEIDADGAAPPYKTFRRVNRLAVRVSDES